MAITYKPLLEAKYAEDAQTTQYTTQTGFKAIIDKFTVTNISGSPATLSVNLLEAGAVVGSDNLIVDARTIAPGECYTLPELVGHIIDSEGAISTLASAASALTIRISGREIS